MASYKKMWRGGYVIESAKGKPLYIIRRRVNGKQLQRSTGCTTEPAAWKELERFELDPLNYKPATKRIAEPVQGAVQMTNALLQEYTDRKVKDAVAEGRTRDWVLKKARLLNHWLADLNGADLRKLNPEVLRNFAEARKTSTMHRIEAIKDFCTWLRGKGQLNRANDPAIELEVPQAGRAIRRRDTTPANIALLHPYLPPTGKQVLTLLAGTGWHVSEVLRFARGGRLVKDEAGQTLAIVRHKKGREHATVLQHPEHLAAAKAILALGEAIPSHNKLCEMMRNATAKCQAKHREFVPFGFGDMRHTVGTFAATSGVRDQDAADFLGHSLEMFQKHYKGVITAPKPVPVIRMQEASLH